MNFRKEKPLRRFKWHFAVIYIGLIAAVLLIALAVTPEEGKALNILWLLIQLALLVAVLAVLSKQFKILNSLTESGEKLEKITETLEKNRSVSSQIAQNTRLSEAAKAIAFRDADRQALREAVFDQLQQKDFDTAYEIVDEIAHREEYRTLSENLRFQVDKYRDATDAERENQIIAHIEKLFDTSQWAKASIQIERLIRDFPVSEKAKGMRLRLIGRKEERKKILLNAWDDAIKRQATDRSLEILRELDLYLTPNEGLALQEAARDVFRNKLHNLGVQFSLAVSGQQWEKAMESGAQIIRDFPNSKMAQEIRGKWDILQQKATQQNNS